MGQLAPVPDTAPVPPQNLEAEESVLGAAMISAAAIAACREVIRADGREFYRESHARIWRAVIWLADHSEPVDAITLHDRLEETGELEDVGGRVRLHELAGLVPATANAQHYARIVAETSQLRDYIRAGGELARLGWERPGDIDELRSRMVNIVDGLLRHDSGATQLDVETWAQFERSATEHVPTIVDGLWPDGGLGFIAAPPKKGKTWVGLALAISVAAGRPFLASFQVEKPEPVVYLALEGHRAAIRGRIGCLARGLGLNPDPGSADLKNLHVVYKPRGLNLADAAWVRMVREMVERVGARLIVVDVLRAAAVMKENSNDEFRDLVRALQPLQDTGCAIAMLHHFGKLTEISRDRSPGERMAGAGAMYGAFDVGVFITGSDEGGRRLRLEFETRDLANPDPIGVHLAGEPTGKNGGFIYTDAASWMEQLPPNEDDLKAPPSYLYELIADNGGTLTASEILSLCEAAGEAISDKTLRNRDDSLKRLGVAVEASRGRPKVYRIPQPAPAQTAIDGISEPTYPHLGSDPGSRHLGTSGVDGTSVVERLNHAGLQATTEHPGSLNGSEVGNGDLQGKHTSEPPTSPTERQPPAAAGPPLLEVSDLPFEPDDDIDWGKP